MRQPLTAIALAFALVLTGCGKDEPTPDPKPTPAQPTTSPVTGLEMEKLPARNPFVVKIENTGGGTPQYGLNDADLVVEQLVEGGLTRLAAVYFSQLPTKIGHVRSARGTDIGIAAPLGATIVASGASRDTKRSFGSANLPFVDGGAGFSSDPAKRPPYHLLLDLAEFARQWDGPADELDASPYFNWKADVAAPGSRVSQVGVRFSGGSSTTFVREDGLWRRVNGRAASGHEFASTNLVVIFAPVVNTGNVDAAGNPVPETRFEGSGKALIVQGDRALDVTWKKDDLRSTIVFTDGAGKEVTMQPGTTWLALAPQGAGSVSSK